MSAMIVFTCPNTGHDVSSGILTDELSFKVLPRRKMSVHCSECGAEHQWWVAEDKLGPLEDVRWPVPARIA